MLIQFKEEGNTVSFNSIIGTNSQTDKQTINKHFSQVSTKLDKQCQTMFACLLLLLEIALADQIRDTKERIGLEIE